jgi:hypothetical protein
MDVTMAVVQRLGIVRGRGILLFAMWVMLIGAPAVRAADDVEWIAPAMLDDVPVRAADIATDPVAPQPIVVPLPTGLETGALALAAMAARRWWTNRRTR